MHTEHTDYEALEAQIRECFGRVVYTHKTHSKMADRAARNLKWSKLAQIFLSSITASGAVSVLFSSRPSLKFITAAVSLASVALTAYMKGFDPGATAQKHRDTAADIWRMRESYLSLLSDLRSPGVDLVTLRKRRDDLQDALAAIYKGAPHTDSRAYAEAQTALKENQEYTFSDPEIDEFLPVQLRKSNKK